MMLNFPLCCLLAAGTLLFLGGAIAVWAKRTPGLWKTLPRERGCGAALALAALAFAAGQSEIMLEGGMLKLLPYIWALVPILTILSFFYLDFLLTRALAGVLMLLVPQLLHGAFVAHLPLRPAFSAICYLTAILGAVMMAAPWRFRDLLERAAVNPVWRTTAAAVCFLFAFAFLLTAGVVLASGT